MLEGEIEANAATALVVARTALTGAGATITDARQLGGLALVLRFECEDHELAPIVEALDASLDLRKGRGGPPEGEGDVHGSLHLTLVGSGDEKVEIPAIPG